MFSIETSSGRSIQRMSYFQHEDEILLPPGRYLKVIDKSSPAQDLHIIHLREIKPPYPMLAEPSGSIKLLFTLPEPKPMPPSPIIGKKQENTPPTASTMLKLAPTPSIIEKETRKQSINSKCRFKAGVTSTIRGKEERNQSINNKYRTETSSGSNCTKT